MSSDKQEDKLLRCMRIILNKCIDPDEKWLRYFILLLRDDDLITKEQSKDLAKVVTKNGCKDAVDKAVFLLNFTESGWAYFAELLHKEDLSVDGKVRAIADAVFNNITQHNEILSLVLMWDELQENGDNMRCIIRDIWNGNETFFVKDWPLDFIHFCLDDFPDNMQQIRDFISAVSLSKSQNQSPKERFGSKISCLAMILRDDIATDSTKLKSLTTFLRNQNIITIDKKCAIDATLGEKTNESALCEIISLILSSDNGKQCFDELLQHESLEIGRKGKDIISVILANVQPEAVKLNLILLWPDLIERHDEVKPVIERIWQGNCWFTESDWPLDFIHFCLNQSGEGLQNVENFISAISPLQKPIENDELAPIRVQSGNTKLEHNSEESVASGSHILFQLEEDIADAVLQEKTLQFVDSDEVDMLLAVVINKLKQAFLVGLRGTNDDLETPSTGSYSLHSTNVMTESWQNKGVTEVADAYASKDIPGAEAKIELRVRFNEIGKSYMTDGWLPVIEIGGKQKQMHLHELGYHYVEVPCGDVEELQYYYALTKRRSSTTKFVTEVLTGSQYRFRDLKENPSHVFLDIAVFCKERKVLNWGKQVDAAMESFLLQPSYIQSDFKCFSASDTYYWLCAVVDGWELRDPLKRHNISMEAIEDHLIAWLQSICQQPTQLYVINRILCTLSVTTAMQKMDHTIRSSKLFKIIFTNLQIQDLNLQNQHKLWQKIKDCWDWRDVESAIRFFLKHVTAFPKPLVLLALPLYGLVNLKENACTTRVIWPTSELLLTRAVLLDHDKAEIWKTFREKILFEKRITGSTNRRKLKKLVGMSTIISVLAETHPYIVDLYQYFLSCDKLIEIVKGKHEIAQKFQIDSVFTQLLPLLEYKSSSSQSHNRQENVDTVTNIMTEYLKRKFVKHIEMANLKDYEDKRIESKKVHSLMKSISCTLEKVLECFKFDSLEKQSISWLLSMAGYCLSWSKALNISDEEDDLMSEILQLVKHYIHERQQRIGKIERKQIEFYDSLFNQIWQDEEFQNQWTKEIDRKIQECHKNLWSDPNDADSYLKLYASLSGKKYSQILDDILLAIATNCAEKLVNSVKPHGRWSMHGILRPFAKALTNAFQKYDDSGENFDLRAMTFIAESTFLLTLYINFEYTDTASLFASMSSSKLNKIHLKAETLIESISEKNISIKEARIILNNRERMETLLSIIENRKINTEVKEGEHAKGSRTVQAANTTSPHIKPLMTEMEQLVQSLECKVNALEAFICVCSFIENDDVSVNCNDLKENLKRTRSCSSLNDAEKFLSDYSDINEMVVMTPLKNSSVFLAKIRKLVGKKRIQALTTSTLPSNAWVINWKIVLYDIWTEIKIKLTDLIQNIKEGSLSSAETTEAFSESKGNEENLKVELLRLYHFHAEILKEKSELEQLDEVATGMAIKIRNTFDVQRNLKILLWFKEFSSQPEIKGDFKIIHNFEKKCLSFGEQEFKSLKKITSITSHQFDLLQSFSKQKELIEWLQSKGCDDVEGMCLVSEKSMYADQWLCLSHAVDGFHELVFHCDKISNIDDILSRCRAVWKKFQVDESFPKKWEDAGKNLLWYQSQEDWLGSAKKEALDFADMANRHGIYTVGCVARNEAPCLANSMKLNLAEENSITKLHDTESKLMLISSEKGAGEIQFLETLKAVEGLAKVYVDLVDSGFMLFNEWRLTVRCNKSSSKESSVMSEKLLYMEVTFRHDLQNLEQTASIADVNELSSVMREALSRWNNYISRMRLEHYFLNEYSIQQISHLCEQLGKVHLSTLDDQTCMMLSNLPRSKLTEFIRQSLNEALTISEEDIRNSEVYDEDNQIGEHDLAIQKKRRAVRFLVEKDNNLSEKVAKAAVQVEGYDDFRRCSNWVVLHENNLEEIDEMSRAFDQEIGIIHEDAGEGTSVLLDQSARTLEGQIKQLQRTAFTGDLVVATQTIIDGYLKTRKGIAMKNCLNVHHLGKFLTILKKKLEPQEENLVVSLRSPFTRGIPNLIMVEQPDVIPVMLSLYSMNGYAPESNSEMRSRLPDSEEILICSEDTTQNEVERFLLKAICKHPIGGKPIYCMAYTEKLEINVSKAMEQSFKKLTHGNVHADKEYQLVILSCYSCHYVAVRFNEYCVGNVSPANQDHIAGYIARELNDEVMPELKRVKVVASQRSGLGKSLHVKRLSEKLPPKCHTRTVRLLEKKINMSAVIERLCNDQEKEKAMLIHIDLTPAVEDEVEKFIFNFCILGVMKDEKGRIWRRRQDQSCIIEVTKLNDAKVLSYTLELLPTVICISPKEALCYLKQRQIPEKCLLMDDKEHKSDAFQRTSQYLSVYERRDGLMNFQYERKENAFMSKVEVIDVLLRHYGQESATWAQLKYFVSFLNAQLEKCEKSDFCQTFEQKSSWLFRRRGSTLQGFKDLVIYFMIKMATDFATPSLMISDESAGDTEKSETPTEQSGTLPKSYKMRRKWEEEEHPYMFFNYDGHVMTFINVNIDDKGNLLDRHNDMLKEQITTKKLVEELKRQGFRFGYYFDKLERKEMLSVLCNIMGVAECFDPDVNYELTTDNVLKIIAIYLRLKCGIPVIIMGETGCGKTRMIEFMCKLMAGKPVDGKTPNTSMKIVKVHGGTVGKDIFESVRDALGKNCKTERKRSEEGQAEVNKKESMTKVLFFDEANTTNAIYAIKEVMCDRSTDGDPFISEDQQQSPAPKLQIVAACNPYKKLSKEALEKLEENGLRYRVSADASNEKLNKITMRTLVYRVVALPPSIHPFVWDFGQLSDATEGIYIRNMISSRIEKEYCLTCEECDIITSVLSLIQAYMRKQNTEYRYVSLRDIERTIILFEWFHKHSTELFKRMDKILQSSCPPHCQIPLYLRCLIHAVGVSYHVSLENRDGFREELSRVLFNFNIDCSKNSILEEYKACQTVFHRDLKTGDNVSWNKALKENVFLIAICADAKLPLYIVGKPGSSKSLAKAIIKTNLKGASSTSSFFKNLNKVEMLSFQCGAQTKASEIEKMFQDAQDRVIKQVQMHGETEKLAVQDAQNRQTRIPRKTEKLTVLTVFDEIGLAEDSPNMPLKALHKLLEDDYALNLMRRNEKKRVTFLGISNWPLDPAKMNRGIFVTRNTPVEEDLYKTTNGIFQGNEAIINQHRSLLENLTKAYLQIYNRQGDQYFGLRDYYSMIKMVYSIAQDGQGITKEQIAYILVRNFSGGQERHIAVFKEAIRDQMDFPVTLVESISLRSLVHDGTDRSNNRFLLLLTKHHSSVELLCHIFPNFEQSASIMFGSSFPGDHTDKELCKNINKIKMCMQQGKLVILLNMVDIYESLYDALNQNYVEFGGQRHATISLGSSEVWVKVHKDFRLVVIERNEVAHGQYPIPLLNRLEKHHLVSQDLLTETQLDAFKSLSQWTAEFADVNGFHSSNAFPGLHEDTISSVILAFGEESLEKQKSVMLDIATADSIFRLPKSKLSKTEDVHASMNYYMQHHVHDCLFSYLQYLIGFKEKIHISQVVTFSSILTEDMRINLETRLQLVKNGITLLFLQSFKVEDQYDKEITSFFERCKTGANAQNEATSQVSLDKSKNTEVLLIQINKAHENGQLVEYAKHYLMSKLQKEDTDSFKVDHVIIIFILLTERLSQKNVTTSKLLLQPTSKCTTIYIDEIGHTGSDTFTTLISSVRSKSMVDVIKIGKENLENDDNFVRCLIQDCVGDAMSKLVDANKSIKIQAERIKFLHEISRGPESKIPNISCAFLDILLDKLIMMCHQSLNCGQHCDWVMEEACSPERLQEGGTFGRTIHLCLKQFISPMLAFIVSVIDVNGNMGILTTSDVEIEWRLDLWLKLFKSLELKFPDQHQLKYTVNSSKNYNLEKPCEFPFSFLINEKLQEIYETAKVYPTDSDREIIFNNLAASSQDKLLQLVEIAWDRLNKKKMMEAYVNDLLRSQFHQDMKDDRVFKSMARIIFIYSMKRWDDLGRDLNGIAISFYNFMELNDCLTLISQILINDCEIVQEVDSWICKQLNNPNYVIHKYAMHSLLDQAYQKGGQIEEEKRCIEWINMSSRVRKIYRTSISLVKSSEEQQEISAKWKPIGLIDSLLTKLIPLNGKAPEHQKLVGIVAQQAKRLFEFVENRTTASEFHSKDVLATVTNVLNASCTFLNTSLMVNWTGLKCLCGKIFQIPVKLPCGKFACYRCARKDTCIYCSAKLPKDLEGIHLTTEQSTMLKAFKADCTGFFLEYLDEYCFEKDDYTNIELKLKAIFQGAIQAISAEATRVKFKLMTSQLNLNLASRSSIVNIIQRVHPDFMKEAMDDILTTNSVDKDLLLVVLKALDTRLLTANSSKDLSECSAEMLRLSWPNLLENCEKLLSYDLLVDVAKVRFAVGQFVKYVSHGRTVKDPMPLTIILRMIPLCQQENKQLINFVFTHGIMHHGRKWFSYIQPLIGSTKYMYEAKDKTLDLWEIFGDDYKKFISVVVNSIETAREDISATLENDKDIITEAKIVKILAILELGKLSWSLSQKIKSALRRSDQEVLLSGSENLKRNLNRIKSLTCQEAHAIYQLVLSSVGAILCKTPLMRELYTLLVNPSATENLFWPAMPESLYHSMKDAMDEEAPYSCPNGHVYFIGDCTYPWMISQCPECGCAIGGYLHMAATGNNRLSTGAVCKTGYKLQEKMMGVDNPGDRITPQAAAIIQFFIHSAMLMALSMKNSSEGILRMIWSQDIRKGCAFLVAKLQENIEEISRSLGCTLDDGLLIILQVNKAIITGNYPKNIDTGCSWQTNESCKEWEKQFRKAYLQPIFHKAEENIFDAKQKLSSMNDMDRLLLESNGHGNERMTCFHPVLWTALRQPSAEHLLHSIIDSPKPGAILKTILQTPNLHFVKHLRDAIELQRTLISRYQYKFDKKNVERISFEKVQRDFDDLKMAELIANYIDLWNQVHPALGARNPSDKILAENMKRIDVNSPITMALPSIRGKGRCAKLLMEYLVMLQNDFLDNCKAADPTLEKFAEVEVAKLLDSHFVCVDKHQDLLPMIQFHTAYTITKNACGQHHRITYNIPALERLVKEKHVMYKKKILKESLPQMRYADTGIGSDWDKLNESVEQIPLPHHMAKEIDEMIDKLVLSEICEKVRTLTETISFLAKVKIQGESETRKLREYLENDLVMTSKHVDMIPRSLLLSQALALYQKLTWHRAVRFVQQGLDPYKDYLHKEDQVKIQDPELLKKLKESFVKTDLVGLQKHINEMLIKTDLTEFRPTWSLKDILPELDYVQESDGDLWCKNLPDDVHLKHVSDLFRLSVQGIP